MPESRRRARARRGVAFVGGPGGAKTPPADTPLSRLGVDTAARIPAEFEAAVNRGEMKRARLFDEGYREIRGTNPKQFLTDYVQFTDRLLPPIQDPVQKADPRIVFSVAWAK